MATVNESQAPDIIDVLQRDHQLVENLLNQFESGVGARDDWFCNVRETLVRHEVAEELAVYPAIRHTGDPSKEVVEARLGEQAEAEKLLSAMESMDLGSAQFDQSFLKLRSAVLEHARNEELSVFPAIKSHRSFEQRGMMGQRYEKAKASAPTHPHPHLPDTPPGNIVLGPVAALADRIRDAMRNDDDQSHLAPGATHTSGV